MKKRMNNKMQKVLDVLKWLFTPVPEAYAQMANAGHPYGVMML